MARYKTANDGATDVRQKIRRKVVRMQKATGSRMIDGDILNDWIKSEDERAADKPGGRARKKAAK